MVLKVWARTAAHNPRSSQKSKWVFVWSHKVCVSIVPAKIMCKEGRFKRRKTVSMSTMSQQEHKKGGRVGVRVRVYARTHFM